MGRYIVGRILSAVPVLILVGLGTFSIMQLVPGDPARVIAGADATADVIAAVRQTLGLDQPWYVQLRDWFFGLMRGDLGQSYLLSRPVAQAIGERLPVTLALTAYALCITLPLGILAGVIAAYRQNTWVDGTVMGLALLGVSLPEFWLAIMLVLFFAVELSWLPTSGYVPLSQGFWPWLRSLTLPAVCLGFFQMALLARITRSSMLEVLRQDYVRTARAKGLLEWSTVAKHALKNAMIPVITVIGIILSLMVSGTVVIEQVFALPGVGRLVIQGILQRDYPVIQGTLLLIASFFVFINIVVDVLYAWLDPRVTYD